MPKQTVLVVDDDPLVRRSIARELGAIFTVIQADSVLEALEVLAGFPVVAVVSDLEMHGNRAAGLELLAEVKARAPDCARVLVTGTHHLGEFQDPIGKLVQRIVLKPWRRSEILDGVCALVALEMPLARTMEIPAGSVLGDQRARILKRWRAIERVREMDAAEFAALRRRLDVRTDRILAGEAHSPGDDLAAMLASIGRRVGILERWQMIERLRAMNAAEFAVLMCRLDQRLDELERSGELEQGDDGDLVVTLSQAIKA